MAQDIEKLKKVLEKIDILAQNNEWFKNELQKQYGGNEIKTFDSFVRLQRDKCRKKARIFYNKIEPIELRNQLTEHYALMLWYKSIGDIGNIFVYANYQIENMLNTYLEKTNCWKIVASKPDLYEYEFITPNSKKFQVSCINMFFDTQTKKPKDVTKILSLWAKMVYWNKRESLLNSERKFSLEMVHPTFSNIVNIRNYKNHAYYINKEIKNPILYYEKDADFYALDYAINNINCILKEMKKSIIKL